MFLSVGNFIYNDDNKNIQNLFWFTKPMANSGIVEVEEKGDSESFYQQQ